jgi:hypothetical protein
MFVAMLILSLSAPTNSLSSAEASLAGFEPRVALEHLQRAHGEGPHDYATHVRLWELTAIANAYLGNEQASLDAFATVLAMDPTHAVDYTLSPKVTFLFSRARKLARERSPITVDVSWPRGRTTGEPIRVTLDMVADPNNAVSSVQLRWSDPEGKQERTVPMSAGATHHEVVIPAQPTGKGPVTLRLAASAFDAAGNEIYRFASDERPRELVLRDAPPPRWYERWWVWTLAGAVVAASTGAGVYVATRPPPETFDATVIFR